MKNFFGWLKKYDNDLLAWVNKNEIDINGITENILRTGVRPQYPEGYVRSQYPDLYFPPATATAPVDLQNSKKVKSKAPANDAP